MVSFFNSEVKYSLECYVLKMTEYEVLFCATIRWGCLYPIAASDWLKMIAHTFMFMITGDVF